MALIQHFCSHCGKVYICGAHTSPDLSNHRDLRCTPCTMLETLDDVERENPEMSRTLKIIPEKLDLDRT